MILELKDQHIDAPPVSVLAGYVVYRDEGAKRHAFDLAERLRAEGSSVDLAFGDRALRKQLGSADRAHARFAIVVGEDPDTVGVKELQSGEQRDVRTDELARVLRDGTAL